MAEVGSIPTTQGRRMRNLAVVGIMGLALSAGAFAVAVSGEDEAALVSCFSAPDLAAPHHDVFDVEIGDAHRRGALTALDATSSCSLVWASGGFDPRADPTNVDPIYPVPPLTACRFNNGLAAVFPNTENIAADKLCGTLGLAVWKPVSGV